MQNRRCVVIIQLQLDPVRPRLIEVWWQFDGEI